MGMLVDAFIKTNKEINNHEIIPPYGLTELETTIYKRGFMDGEVFVVSTLNRNLEKCANNWEDES